jgi:DNA polymerase I-like protein with 3'-5' exonuclease and polymerase domains
LNPRRRIFIEADLIQAEAQCVAWLSNDEELIHAFLSNLDTYKIVAASVKDFHITNIATFDWKSTLGKQRRYIGKKLQLATGYGLGPQRFSDSVAEETDGELVLPLATSTIYLDNYHEAHPGVRNNFHQHVRDCLDENMTLYTPPPFNRRRVFWGKPGEEGTYQEGFANIPQSTVVDIVTNAYKTVSREGVTPTNIHDALVAEIDVADLIPTYYLMKSAMTQTINFSSISKYASTEPLTIPVAFEIGYRLGALEELKGLGDEAIEHRFREIQREAA